MVLIADWSKQRIGLNSEMVLTAEFYCKTKSRTEQSYKIVIMRHMHKIKKGERAFRFFVFLFFIFFFFFVFCFCIVKYKQFTLFGQIVQNASRRTISFTDVTNDVFYITFTYIFFFIIFIIYWFYLHTAQLLSVYARKGRLYIVSLRWLPAKLVVSILKLHLTFGQTEHYENMPIQIYWKFHHQKMKIFRYKILIFFIFLLKT